MLTLRATFKNGQVTFIDEVPLTGEYQVLVTFLDTDDEITVVPRHEFTSLVRANMGLTPRELQILPLIQRGMTNKDIARTLELGTGTVRNYVSSIINKLGTINRTQAVDRAVELGVLPPRSDM